MSRSIEEKIRVRKKCNFKFKLKKFKKYSKSQISESPLGLGISNFKSENLIKHKQYQEFQISVTPLGLGVHRTNRKFSKTHNWKFRNMRILRWFYDILFSMLIAGVYSMQHMIAPTLEDIKNKLRSSAGIGGYGCLLYTSPSPRDS